ncbi:hypothetical protein DFJ73DRAFT_855426 [Zopfochytrium polystomum]|nr:hypothetical protein DFJ73DRAFT_855426 [Zopfochytrium polystomum]
MASLSPSTDMQLPTSTQGATGAASPSTSTSAVPAVNTSYAAGAAPIDIVLLSVAVGMATLLLFAVSWRFVATVNSQRERLSATSGGSGLLRSFRTLSGGGLGFISIALIASICQEFKAIVALAYTLQLWLEPKLRYFSVYFMLLFPTLLLYFLYERRLALLFAHNKRVAAAVYGWTLRLLLVFYLFMTVVVTYYFTTYAVNTATGGYSSAPPNGWYLRVILYSVDMAIGAVILSGTFHALLGMIQDQKALGANATPLFQVILGSDCLKFVLIAAIEAYKLATTSDPNGNLGRLQQGNTGFQHVIDTLKLVLMTANLFAPTAIAKVAAAKSMSKKGSSGDASFPLSSFASTNNAMQAV